MHFVSSSIYEKAIRLALAEGLSPELIAHERPREARQGTKYVPIDLLFDIYEVADRYLTPGFGVRQGRQLNSEDYGTLGLSWRTCMRAREVFDRTERFMVLVTDHGSIRVEESDGITKLLLFRDAFRKGVEIANEATFVMITGVLHEITGRKVLPASVLFKHASEESTSFQDFFQCPVEFGSGINCLHFRTSHIDIPTLKADEGIHQFLVEHMDDEKKGIETIADKFMVAIHSLVSEALPGGVPSLIQVAEHMGMSTRTLKRRLAGKNQTFRQLVQQVQNDVSISLLQKTSQSIGEIAFQAGFSEQSAFNRAFKRWTGKSPADYRRTC